MLWVVWWVMEIVAFVFNLILDHLYANPLLLTVYIIFGLWLLVYLAMVYALNKRYHNESENREMKGMTEWKQAKSVDEILTIIMNCGGFYKQKGIWKACVDFEKQKETDRVYSKRTQRRFNLTNKSVVLLAVDAKTYSISFEDCALALSLAAHVFLVVQLDRNEDTEKAKKDFIQMAKNVVGRSVAGVPTQRVLFCGTRIGRVAIARQLKPDLLIETDLSVVHQLVKHVRSCVLVQYGASQDEKREVKEGAVTVVERYGEIFELSL